MKALDHSPTRHHGSKAASSIIESIGNAVSTWSETIWLCITFLLFILMGPFSVIAVIYGLWTLSNDESREKMVEPVSC